MKVVCGRRTMIYEPGEFLSKVKNNIVPDAEFDNVKDLKKYIAETIKNINITNYYTRINIGINNDLIDIDFGSWSEFIVVYDLTPEQINEYVYGERNDNK